MDLSQEVIDEILIEYKRTRSPFRTATNLGLETSVVWEIIEKNQDRLSAFPERNGGFGPENLVKYIAGRRRVSSREWDNKDPAIARARASYELGTHDMATGRDGGWLILYSIPLKKRFPRTDYFRPEM